MTNPKTIGGKRLLVFSGAGASCAVNNEQFPTTIKFFERLPPSLLNEPLVKIIQHRCAQRFGEGPTDIEKILWSLQELLEFFSAINDPSSPVSWVAEGNQIQAAVGAPHGINEFIHLAGAGRPKIATIRDEIAAQVYKFYSYEPKDSELSGNWSHLLSLVSQKGYWLDLVTTNYDLVLETLALQSGLNIGSGFSTRTVRRLNLNFWNESISRENEFPYQDGLITKLHGSVHWEAEDDQVVSGGTRYKGSHLQHALISPGFKGAPKNEPFLTFHNYFERSLTRCEAALFVGFAFRDEYINQIIQRNIGDRAIYCIDPSTLDAAPAFIRESVRHIEGNFDEASIDQFFTKLVGDQSHR